jgi:hypothetical protein
MDSMNVWTSSDEASCQGILNQLLVRYLFALAVVTILFLELILSRDKNRKLAAVLAFTSWTLRPVCPRGCSCSESALFTIVNVVLPLVYMIGLLFFIVGPTPRENNVESSEGEAQTTEPSAQNPYANMTYA